MLDYSDFRCGLTFTYVRRTLAAEQAIKKLSGERMYVTRRTVLGRMRELKQGAWRQYVRSEGEKTRERPPTTRV